MFLKSDCRHRASSDSGASSEAGRDLPSVRSLRDPPPSFAVVDLPV